MFTERLFPKKLEQMEILVKILTFFIAPDLELNIELKMSPKMIDFAHHLLQRKEIKENKNKFPSEHYDLSVKVFWELFTSYSLFSKQNYQTQ